MATIKDVAARAGISYTTVSHVVNGTRPVSDSARDKVQAAIAELGYVPSGVARSLRVRATGTLGLLVPNASNPYFAELARGIEDHAERNGYSVILCNSDDDGAKQLRYLRVLLERRIDGLIVATVTRDAAFAQALAAVKLPLMLVDRSLDGVSADRLQIDHEQGGYLATRHLLELGHRRIACIAGPVDTQVAQLRVAGYQRALVEAGLPAAEPTHCAFTSPAGHATALGLLSGETRPTAIFAGNDMIALGVLRAAAERGVRVPQELSLVGFDDIEVSRYLHPALTTVGQHIGQLGERAAERLLQRVRTPELDAEQWLLEPTLMVRESTAVAGG
ncbi:MULTISPECIES: LacI family DNA-binding transcriptional regulator [Pseudomonas]|uniref:LacI family transcriptional regulator n=2 Tax=Pseudomonadaceae TaxID=135621 RepID=A0A0D0L3R4_9PSED|nr:MULTISPECIES: LacI family DNA-binding transcriptional regulator [Pseudomonas]KIQ04323.1 LacI family transcriptional regulator [Pseudomonas fulva]MCW2293404.1 LacI family transcriptional regulator [Pseudomonas sp. BIGb0408]NYH72025.1 LacI family transcriptional regulator [Pseudomonas flavescens]